MIRHELRRLGKSVLIYGVVNRVLSFALLPMFTAYLSPTDYGILSILGVVAMVLVPIFSLGFEAATGPCYFEGNVRERKEATIWTAFTILAASALILAASGFLWSGEISRLAFRTPRYHYPVTLTLLSACLTILSLPWGLYLRFEERAGTFVALAALSALISIGLSVLMVVVLRRSVLGMIEAQLLGGVLTLLLYLVFAAPRLRFRVDLRLGRELLRLGIPLVPGFVFLFVIHQGNKYILQWFHGPASVGMYAVGFNLGLAMQLAVSAFQSAWLPYFMSFADMQDEARVLFPRILRYYVMGFGALCVLFFIAAKPVVMIMAQPAFRGAYQAVGPSAAAQFLGGMSSILLPGLYFAKDVKYVTVVQAAAAVVAVGVDLLLIPSWGLLGAAVALMVGTLATVVLQQAWNTWRKRDYLIVNHEWDRIFAFALVYVGFLTLALWGRDFPLSTELYLSVSACMGLLLALCMLLTPTERQIVGSAFRRLHSVWLRAGMKPEL